VLVWMDLEMTGLEPERHVIVEIATLLTDDHLNIVAEGPDLVIHATADELAQMGSYVTEMHTKSGLLPQIIASSITVDEAQRATLEFLKAQGVEPGAVPLCGNSIGTDRRFLQEYMPQLEAYFHYRNVDVSTIKELARRWYPGAVAAVPEKDSAHRALDDIRESINELVHYRDTLFQPIEEKK
jgi:oligoribonuclease